MRVVLDPNLTETGEKKQKTIEEIKDKFGDETIIG